MKNRTLKVSITCALAALIGAFIGIEYDYSIIIGMLAGGITGYLFWEAPTVFKAIPIAYKNAKMEPPEKMSTIKIEIKNFIYLSLAALQLGLMFIFMFLLMFVKQGISIFNTVQFVYASLSEIPILGIGEVIMASAIGAVVLYGNDHDEKISLVRMQKRADFVFKYLNPVAAPFTVSYYIVYGLVRLLAFIVEYLKFTFKTFIPWIFSIIWRFIRNLFLLIHSEERVLCFTYAAISAGVGVFFHSAFLAAIIGAGTGVAVSKFIDTFSAIRMKVKY